MEISLWADLILAYAEVARKRAEKQKDFERRRYWVNVWHDLEAELPSHVKYEK